MAQEAPKTITQLKEELDAFFAGTGQEHVLRYWDSLQEEHQRALHRQVTAGIAPTLPKGQRLDFYNNVFSESMKLFQGGVKSSEVKLAPPEEKDFFFFTEESRAANESHRMTVEVGMRQTGLKAIREGKAAIVVLAGGSGTRLGQTLPKGMLVCPQLSQQKSLYQLLCEKVRRVETLAGAEAGAIQVCFMTSIQTDKETRAFFAANNNFGLVDSQLSFTDQCSVPVFNDKGKILLARPFEIAMAPGGNGGIYEALSRGGVLDRFEKAGATMVQIFTVDNILARIADPEFYGFAQQTSADVVVKSTPKAHDHEAVGVFASRNGEWGVVEYTEIGKQLAEATDANGRRLYDCANIAIHLCTTAFLRKAASIMESFLLYHVAKKPINTDVSDDVQQVEGQFPSNSMGSPSMSREDSQLPYPKTPLTSVDGWLGKTPAVKLEAFIFDIFKFSDNFKILQVDRHAEFSAIKNADDGVKKDNPSTAVADVQRQHYRWLARLAREAGDDVCPTDVLAKIEANVREGVVEVSPLASYGGENLQEYVTDFVKAASVDGKPEKPLKILSALEKSRL